MSAVAVGAPRAWRATWGDPNGEIFPAYVVGGAPKWIRELGLCSDHWLVIQALARRGALRGPVQVGQQTLVRETGLETYVVRASIDYLKRRGLMILIRAEGGNAYDLRPLAVAMEDARRPITVVGLVPSKQRPA